MRRSQRDGIEVLFIFIVLFLEASQHCLCMNQTDHGCIEEERQALLKFRDSFENCSRHVLAWEGKQCCRWKGIECDGITGHVVKIDLSPKNYSVDELVTEPANCTFSKFEELTNGSFIINYSLSSKAMSSSLLEFQYLNHLDLSFIDFQCSPIPLFLGSMKQLQYLNLSHCYFSGKVPHHLGNLTNLQVLDFNTGDQLVLLNGTCDRCLFFDDFNWVSQLSTLRFIDMSGVYIKNGNNYLMQVIYNLPLLQAHFMYCGIESLRIPHGSMNSSMIASSKVQALNLKGNQLSGPVPKALQNMSSLEFLDISDNMIDSIPLWLGEFRFLTSMNLAQNMLSGSFPNAIQNMSSLRFLDLSYNTVTSAVPLWLIKRVHHVNLTHNKFSDLQSSHTPTKDCNLTSLDLPDVKALGGIFESFKNIDLCSKNVLQTLDLSHNELKDHIESLGQLKNSIYLSLSSNLIHGPIPLSFGELTNLRVLILEDNQLNGTIPAFLGRLPALRVLDLSGNHLIGITPDNLGNLENLRTLNLSGNHLSGIIPDNLRKLINLRTLDLSTNYLEGTLTEIHLHNLSYLQDLRVGMNKLSVKLAPNWLAPFQLTNLQLKSCKIETPFPQWLKTQKKLVNLDLSDTGIWGPFPKWFQQKDLSVLDLSNNKISGELPTNLSDMIPNLNSLFLANNLLNGSIPKSLCKLEWLHDLDISNNKFSGRIPSCLGEVDWVALIDLSSNELASTIPESFCSFYSSLQSLNLSNNSLHGEIPSTLGSCSKLDILDLGNNQLSGLIPSSIGDNLVQLQILRLRQNKFSGAIPLSLCQLLVLQSLDLASNNLIGTIPFCLGHLQGMALDQSTDMVFLAPGPADGPMAAELLAPGFDGWDKEHVKQVMKGRELDFTKNLKFVVNLDLSNNSLVGFIPEVLTSLTKLVGLNLSHNYLSGEIPSKIGKMKLLESLDLSWNSLAGPLPSSMSSLTSLSHLNVSYNNFSGPIPEGNQFFTLEDPSIYVGNQYLCGEPVLMKCHSDENNQAPISVDYEDKNEKEKILFYFVVALGFMTGFWGIIALLLLNKSLRYACFRYMEKIGDEIYVAVAIRKKRW